jgi:hypothetical protein
LIDNENDFKVATTSLDSCGTKENDINQSDVSVISSGNSCSQAAATAPTTDGNITENKNTQNDTSKSVVKNDKNPGGKIQQSYLALTNLGMGNRGNKTEAEILENQDVNIKHAVETIDVANVISKNISQDIIADAKGNAYFTTTAIAKIDSKIDDVDATENIPNFANMPITTTNDNLQQFDGKIISSSTANNLENTESTSNIKIPMLEQAEISTAVDKMSEIPVTDSITTVNELTRNNNNKDLKLTN